MSSLVDEFFEYILTVILFEEDDDYLYLDDEKGNLLDGQWADMRLPTEMDTLRYNWPTLLNKLESDTTIDKLWTKERLTIFLQYYLMCKNPNKHFNLLGFLRSKTQILDRLDKKLVFNVAIKLNLRDCYFWLANWFSVSTKDLANLIVKINSDQCYYQLFDIYLESRVLPTIRVDCRRAHIYSKSAPDFCLHLKETQIPIHHNDTIVDICLALAPLQLPAYVLLAIIDYAVEGPLDHYFKIMKRVIPIKDIYRKKN